MRQIRRVAVLGAGVMGATIAAQLANAGMEVQLLDMVTKELSEAELGAGLSLESPRVRNRLADAGLDGAIKARPAAFYLPEYAARVQTGNFEDHMGKIRDCDWVIEVVVEQMAIKKKLFAEKVLPNLAEGAVLSTNTSGLSVNEMAEVLPQEVRRNFLATHFFNPPRYMRLLEIVPCNETDPALVSAMAEFVGRRLGKGVVYAKDTPNFIANRIGVYSIFNAMKHMLRMEMTVEEVDAVAGPATARPKSAAFRTADLVGIDTLVHVGDNSHALLTGDEERGVFKVPDFLRRMVEKGQLGNKSKKGFFRKEKSAEGSRILYFDYRSGEYRPLEKPRFASLQGAKLIEDPAGRLRAVVTGSDRAAEFAWWNLRDTLLYTFNRLPEIADDVVNVDNAMRWGFNWELGPFEMFDALGVGYVVERAEKDGVAVPGGLKGIDSFYRFENGKKLYFDLTARDYRPVPYPSGEIRLEILRRAGNVVEKNANCSLIDLGDGVFGFEFHSKMNAISGDILAMTHKALRRAESDGIGLVIGNQGANFSVGANLMMLAVALAEGAWEDIDPIVRAFQNATMAVKYARVPVVAAPFNLTLGGACEFTLHAHAVNAYAETYMGLVEVGVGLLPAGGGIKEMALRAIELAGQFGTDPSSFIFKYFKQIGTAAVSRSADELFAMGYLRRGDSVTLNQDRLLSDAKQKVIALAGNFRPNRPLEGLKAPGRGVAASIKSSLWNLKMGGFATDYDAEIGGVIADIICGGGVPAGTLVSEQDFLDLEREGFMRLCRNPKTAARVQHMLKTGKPLRN